MYLSKCNSFPSWDRKMKKLEEGTEVEMAISFLGRGLVELRKVKKRKGGF